MQHLGSWQVRVWLRVRLCVCVGRRQGDLVTLKQAPQHSQQDLRGVKGVGWDGLRQGLEAVRRDQALLKNGEQAYVATLGFLAGQSLLFGHMMVWGGCSVHLPVTAEHPQQALNGSRGAWCWAWGGCVLRGRGACGEAEEAEEEGVTRATQAATLQQPGLNPASEGQRVLIAIASTLCQSVCCPCSLLCALRC